MSCWPADVLHRAPVNDFPPAWARSWGDDTYGLWADLAVGNVTQRMRWIEPSLPEGFWVGSPNKERNALPYKEQRELANRTEGKHRSMTISDGFWLGDTPCVQAFWLAVVGGKNPSRFKKVNEELRRPVEQVPLEDDAIGLGVIGFLRLLNQCLPETRAGLPTDEEWEYACRADTSTAYWWGDEFDAARSNTDHSDEVDWYSFESTTPVKNYLPNPWGLHDMHGNVWEWTASPWRELPGDAASSVGTTAELAYVVRGGSWSNAPGEARSASRRSGLTNLRSSSLGFRLVLRASKPDPVRSTGTLGFCRVTNRDTEEQSQ